MGVLSELVVGGGSAAFVLHLLRRARRREAFVQSELQGAYRPPPPSPTAEPPRRRSADSTPMADAGRDEASGPYLLDPSRDGGRLDATASMMAVMAGPGLCTPRS